MFIVLALLSLAFFALGVFAYRQNQLPFKWVWISGAALTGLLVGFVAVLAFSFAHPRPELGVGLASVKWLDSRASDISYFRANDFEGNVAYEFRISPCDFEALARERGWRLTPLDLPRKTLRYTFFLPESDPRRQDPLAAEVSRGFFFEDRRPDGAGITVLYDAHAMKAYVWQSSR